MPITTIPEFAQRFTSSVITNLKDEKIPYTFEVVIKKLICEPIDESNLLSLLTDIEQNSARFAVLQAIILTDNTGRLAPLLIACIMTNKLAIAKRLLELGFSATQTDHHNWTAAHHAALLGHIELLQKMYISIAEWRYMLTDESRTVEDFLSFRGTYSRTLAVPPSGHTYHFEKDPAKTAYQLTATNFTEITKGAKWLNSRFVRGRNSAEIFNEIWYMGPYDRAPDTEMTAKLARFTANQPNLRLVLDVPKLGSSVRTGAKETIKSGELITKYSGVFDSEHNLDSDPSYLLGPVNALTHRNLGAMIADGFPNAVLINIRSKTDYLGQEIIICALEDMGPNTDIYIDYGSHDIKKFYYTIPNSEAIRAFFAANPLDLTLLKAADSDTNLKTKLIYIANTPSAFLFAVWNNLIPMPNESNIMMYRELFQLYATDEDLMALYLNFLFEFHKKSLPEHLSKIIKSFYLALIKKGHIQVIHNSFQCIDDVLSVLESFTKEQELSIEEQESLLQISLNDKMELVNNALKTKHQIDYDKFDSHGVSLEDTLRYARINPPKN